MKIVKTSCGGTAFEFNLPVKMIEKYVRKNFPTTVECDPDLEDLDLDLNGLAKGVYFHWEWEPNGEGHPKLVAHIPIGGHGYQLLS